MRQAICFYAARGGEKLRGEYQYCRFISAFVKTSPFALNEPYYGNSSASMKLLTPTQDSRDIINAAVKCLDKIWRDGHRYQKAGIMLGDFFSKGVAQLNLLDEIVCFAHIFGGGYAAGYYAYLWTQMLADDGYQWFVEQGGLTRENGQKFREAILSRGNSTDLAELYRQWRGHDPRIEPMLENRGLSD